MATTGLGIPLVDFDTDQPNGAGQINAVAESVDALIAARLLPAARHLGGHAIMTGLSSGTNPVGGPWPTTAYNVGDISYGAGIFTVARAGLYEWRATLGVSGPSSASVLWIRGLVNGSVPTNADGSANAPFADVAANGGTFYVQAGGPVALASGNTVQLDLYVVNHPVGIIVWPLTYSLFKVG